MKNTKNWLFSALILFIIGFLLAGIAFVSADFRLENLSNQEIIENTYEPEGEYDEIIVNILNADVFFAHSADGKTRVEIREIEKIPHYVQVSDNKLQITARDTREWMDRLNFGAVQTSVTIYLPENFYESVFALTRTGDISVPGGFSFESLELSTSTGKLSVNDVDSEDMTLSGTTGRIILANIDVQNELTAHMTTGDVSMKGLKTQKMTVSTTTGDVMMEDVLVQDLMSINATTGDITFRQTDAGEVFMKCTTGDIHGSFLTEKIFEAKATTGHVSVPDTKSGGLCRAKTTTGFIQIEIEG